MQWHSNKDEYANSFKNESVIRLTTSVHFVLVVSVSERSEGWAVGAGVYKTLNSNVYSTRKCIHP